MKIINLTPHAVTIHVNPMPTFSATVDIPPSGTVPRCAAESTLTGHVTINGVAVPVYSTTIGAVSGIPDPADGVAYIVSRIVAEACPERTDLYIPGEAVRDGVGRVVGCKGLCQLTLAPAPQHRRLGTPR